MTAHEHIDGSGEGYCSCGAERCSLPGCDGYCVHPGGWVEREELAELRSPSAHLYIGGLIRHGSIWISDDEGTEPW